ncbi:hypothetical protein K470DRAFT_268885 [Piedraia hortae CBS 480.64]|uniref:DUF659 domain-containing protein n=1 Tax=Piedraia hortae CBS 480.64 TaxID=1314780 RepID=A0A6A7C5M8_9PEZI|nr:hypothetical protein K470DRAFT_268885 [Piedraia hortae CBS 480.64]
MFTITTYWARTDWDLTELTLAVEEVPGPQYGENMAPIVVEVLDSPNVNDRVISMTTDNATNNDTTCTGLIKKIPFARSQHLPCIGHIFNIAVQAGLKAGQLNG